MYIVMNGREVEIPTDFLGRAEVDDIRESSGIDDERPLVLMRPDGSNFLVNPGQKVSLARGSSFMDVPVHTRGRNVLE